MGASTYRLVNGADTLTLSGTSGDSPFLVVRSEFSPAPRRVVGQERVGRSGRFDLTRFHDASEFAATLRVQGDQDLTRFEYLDLLKGFLTPSKRPYLYLQRDGWLSERRALLRGDGESVVIGNRSGQYLEVGLRAVMPDGVIEANEPTIVTLRPGALNVGWGYPKAYPAAYTPSNVSNIIWVTPLGNIPTPPYVRIFGGCSQPRLQRTLPDGTLKQMYLSKATIASGSYLDIDFANYKIFLNGEESNSFYSTVDFSVSDWFDLEPGDNKMLFTAGTADSGCYAEITYRDYWTP